MLKEHVGKAITGVLTTVILGGLYLFGGLIIGAVELKAEDFVKKINQKELSAQQQALLEKYQELEDKLSNQSNGTRTQIFELQKAFSEDKRARLEKLERLETLLHDMMILQLQANANANPGAPSAVTVGNSLTTAPEPEATIGEWQ